MNPPNQIVVDVGDSVKDLKKAISCPSLPHIDLDVLVEKTVDAIAHKGEAAGELSAIAQTLIFGGEIVEHHSFEDYNGCETYATATSLNFGTMYRSKDQQFLSAHRSGKSHAIERMRSIEADLVETAEENILGSEVVGQHATAFGQELLQLFKEHKLFEEDYLLYEFAGILNERSLVLRRR